MKKIFGQEITPEIDLTTNRELFSRVGKVTSPSLAHMMWEDRILWRISDHLIYGLVTWLFCLSWNIFIVFQEVMLCYIP